MSNDITADEDFHAALVEQTKVVAEMRACLDDMEQTYAVGSRFEKAIMLPTLKHARHTQALVEQRTDLLQRILASKAAA